MTNLDESQLTIGQIAYQILTGEGVTDVAWAQFFKLFFENCKDEDGENRYFYAFELKNSVYDIVDKIRAHETAILDKAKTAEEKEEKIYRLGDKFNYAGGTIMLSSAAKYKYVLIFTDKANEGCRAGDPVDLGSEKKIFTEQELTTIAGTLRPYMTLIDEETNND